MPGADEIRRPLETRIEALGAELCKLRAAHAALTADAEAEKTDNATRAVVISRLFRHGQVKRRSAAGRRIRCSWPAVSPRAAALVFVAKRASETVT
jgi:hypothetical protein